MGLHAHTAPTSTPQGTATPEGGSSAGSTAQSDVSATDATAVAIQEAAGGNGAVLKVLLDKCVLISCSSQLWHMSARLPGLAQIGRLREAF